MNLFYEAYPESIFVNGEEIPIVTDFREIIRMIDMLKDDSLAPMEKGVILMQYFEKEPCNFKESVEALTDFIAMTELNNKDSEAEESHEEEAPKKNLYSFQVDYPYIFSAFLRDYDINLRTVPYMHWWEFRMLFNGLSEDTEIKQRIMYRGINLSEIKDPDERRRIEKIQRAIKLPEEKVTDYDIGDALW